MLRLPRSWAYHELRLRSPRERSWRSVLARLMPSWRGWRGDEDLRPPPLAPRGEGPGMVARCTCSSTRPCRLCDGPQSRPIDPLLLEAMREVDALTPACPP